MSGRSGGGPWIAIVRGRRIASCVVIAIAAAVAVSARTAIPINCFRSITKCMNGIRIRDSHSGSPNDR